MLVNWKVVFCENLPDNLQSPDYFITNKPYWFFKYLPADMQVDVIDVSSICWLEKFESNKIRFYIWQTLKVLYRLNQYDLVISHGMQSGIVLAIIRRIFGKGKYKHLIFDIGAFNSARESGQSLKLMQFASKSIDYVVYHTQSQIEYYKKCHPWLVDKSTFIPFGTDYDFFTREIPDHIYKCLDVKDYILCVGYNKRDWSTLVEAYSKIKTDVKLVMLGHVDDKISDIDSRIIMLPKVSVEELRCWIKDALFCVLPLEYMNYSFGQMTLLQQMAMGKAVICADVPSIQAYKVPYDNPENIVVYKAGDSEDLRQKITNLLSEVDLMIEIATNAQKSVSDYFNEEKMAQDIYKVIEKVMRD